MLGAVMFGHQRVPAGDPGDHRAGRDLRQGAVDAAAPLPEKAAIEAQLRDAIGPLIDAAYREQGKQDAQQPARRGQGAGRPSCSPTKASAALALQAVQGAREGDRARRHPRGEARASTAATPRPCGRSSAEVGILPRAHGSALFTRGETQALVVATLGTGQDEQIIDALEGEYRENFMLHYNFPPYSTGEAGRMGSPGRREIGHGKLAWRAVRPLLPTKESFPYTIRVVSEITELNGSSSMASVCGASLSLMDAGRAAAAPGRRHRDGADQGARGLCRAVRHPRRRGSSRRHGLQGRRHRATASPRCRWTSRSPRSPRRSCGSRSTRRATAASTSSARWPRR